MKKYTFSEIEEFIILFESCKIPKKMWTHESHLLVAIWYGNKYPLEDCMNMVREKIKAHNESIGIPNTESRGYIETTTYFWIVTVKCALEQYKDLSFEDKANNIIEELKNSKELIYEYYSKEYMKAPPRSRLKQPDVKDFYDLKKR